jgi:tetratricopeptide (TPR) repeat protein
MQERSFSIHNTAQKIHIKGGNLWQAKPRSGDSDLLELTADGKQLSIYLQPTDDVNNLREALYTLVRTKSQWHYFMFSLSRRLPSILFILPAIVTVCVFAFFTVWGDLVIDWAFMNPDEGTALGLSRRFSLLLYGIVAIFILGFFPMFFTGDHDSAAQAIGNRFSNRRLVKQRFYRIFKFLKRNAKVEEIILWNPSLMDGTQDWVQRSLLPAILDTKLAITLQIKIDERNLAEQSIEKLSKEDTLHWKEEIIDYSKIATKPISKGYLENWEKRILAIYVFASTANTQPKWKELEGTEKDGVLNNAVSLRLADFIIQRFKERLFSEEDRALLISTDAFAGRCVNDFGILTPCLQYTNDIWKIADDVVKAELIDIQNELRFVYSFLQVNIEELAKRLKDPVAALVLNSVHQNSSIYNNDRLEAIRFFVTIIRDSEQYKIMKQYWNLVIDNSVAGLQLNEDIYRILGIPLLLDLATIFEKAAMYDHAHQASGYIETVFPYRGMINKARIAERQGRFEDSVTAMLEIIAAQKQENLKLEVSSIVDLNLNISWAVVSGRLENHRKLGRELLSEAQQYLYADFDKVRNSEQIIRLYNVLANFEEWEGRPEGAIENYDKALQIPGVTQAQLSNLLVNKGIALRQINQLSEGVYYGQQGAEVKLAIGDADQAPIALHNLAQTILMLAKQTHDNQESLALFKKAAHYAKIGLDIQNQTGSVKKRGQLLVEYFIGIYMLMEEKTEIILAAWENARKWMGAEIAANRQNTYDAKVVAQELMSMLTGDTAASLETVYTWKPKL